MSSYRGLKTVIFLYRLTKCFMTDRCKSSSFITIQSLRNITSVSGFTSPANWVKGPKTNEMGNYRASMLMRLGSRESGWRFRLVRLLFASVLFIASSTPRASAQSTDDTWAEPLNLSHSGVAIKPVFVIDSEAVLHVVWQDDLANYVYTQFDGDQWTAPETTDLDRLFMVPIAGEFIRGAQPEIYTGPNPLFIAGPDQYIYAFWISPQGRLFTSKVENLNFEDVAAWDSGGVIAPAAASFAVAVDALGEWHLAYFRTVDDPVNPAGIYYTRSKN